MYKMNTDTCQ